MLKTKTIKIITVQEWDRFVTETYGKPYRFQQQDGCKERGIFEFDVPMPLKDFPRKELTNNREMGVSFVVWLTKNTDKTGDSLDRFKHQLWWERNFYPHVSMIIDDLHKQGLLEVGSYGIKIDW